MVLVLLIEVELGCEDDKSTHLNILEHGVKSILVPTIIVDHTCRNYYVIFTVVAFVEFSKSKDHFLEILVAFCLLSRFQETSAAVNTSDVKESVFFEVLTDIPFSATQIKNLGLQSTVGDKFFQNESADLGWESR